MRYGGGALVRTVRESLLLGSRASQGRGLLSETREGRSRQSLTSLADAWYGVSLPLRAVFSPAGYPSPPVGSMSAPSLPTAEESLEYV